MEERRAHTPAVGLAVDIAAVLGAFAIAVAIAGPLGSFALNDDWSWAAAARRLLVDHEWRPTDWTSMTLITHAGWGALFCAVAGNCSAETLRWSTIAAAAVALVATCLVASELRLPRRSRLLLTAMLGANPLFFALSFTFMTDVTFAAYAALASLFYVRALRTEAATDVAVATVLTVLAVLCRQVALFLPAAFLVATLVRARPSLRALAIAVPPLVISAAAMVGFNAWMGAEGVTPSMYSDQANQLLAALHDGKLLARNLVAKSVTTLLYAGLFCLPAFALWGSPKAGLPLWARRVAIVAAILFALVAMAACIGRMGPMPVSGNVLNSAGVGPHSIYPFTAHPLYAPRFAGAVDGLWWLATAAAVLGGALIVHRLVTVAAAIIGLGGPLTSHSRALEAFFLCAALIYAAPMVVAGFYDRYLLPLLLVTPLIGITFPRRAAGRWRPATAWGLVGVLAVLSIGWTHDYMSWNRARWATIDRLTSQGVPAFRLNGGFEFISPPCYVPVRRCDPSTDKVVDEAYVVAFVPRPGYRVVSTTPFSSWLPPGRHQILALERIDPRQ